jgi:hypothetical protein
MRDRRGSYVSDENFRCNNNNNDTQHIILVLDLVDFSALQGALYENHVMNGVTPISREQIEVLL